MIRSIAILLVSTLTVAQAQTFHVAVPLGSATAERIHAAAETACGPLPRTSSGALLLNGASNRAFCIRRAERTALASLGRSDALVASK